MEHLHIITQEEMDTLNGSIEKWDTVRKGDGEDRGAHNCPLCELHFMGGCIGCIIRTDTSKGTCKDTPYRTWVDHLKNSHYGKDFKCYCKICTSLADDEYNYLVDLKAKCRVE